MNPSGLKPWQPAAASHLVNTLAKNGAAVDGSEMGTGKTFVAGAVIRHLNFPTLVVCPRVSIPIWKKMGLQIGAEFDCLNYEMIRTGRTPYGKWADKSFQWASEVHFLVFDEFHRCNGLNTQNSDLLIGAKNQRIYTLGLSATLGDNPAQLKAIGYLLGLHALNDRRTGPKTIQPGFNRWAQRHGCYISNGGRPYFAGSDERKRAVMGIINEQIFPARGVRVRKADLPGVFPECQIFAELYDMGDAAKVNVLWEEMGAAMQELKARMAFDKSPNNPNTRLVRARQELELLKVPTFVEVARDTMAQGYSVALFVCFRQTLDELCRRLNIKCRVDGSQVGEKGARDRAEQVEIFQSNQERILGATIDAGCESLSLDDQDGNYPRVGIASLGYSAIKVQQLFGRLNRADSKSKAIYRIPLAAGTLDERVHRAVTAKLNRGEALMDGDLDANNLALG